MGNQQYGSQANLQFINQGVDDQVGNQRQDVLVKGGAELQHRRVGGPLPSLGGQVDLAELGLLGRRQEARQEREQGRRLALLAQLGLVRQGLVDLLPAQPWRAVLEIMRREESDEVALLVSIVHR